MKKRPLGRSGLMLTEISLGCEHLEHASQEVIDATLGCALDHGVNYIDMFMATAPVRDRVGRALRARRSGAGVPGRHASWLLPDRRRPVYPGPGS